MIKTNILKSLVTPFSRVTTKIMTIVLISELLLLLLLWSFNSFAFLPTPKEVLNAVVRLSSQDSLISEFWTSLKLCLKAMFIATIISAIISYLSLIPVTKYISTFITKGRFLTLIGLSFFFTLLTSSGGSLKTSLLVFGITVFFTTSFISYLKDIPEYTYNHARTLGLSPWETLFEVVIYGRLSQLMDVVTQTFAIAWTMLTLVEGIVRSEGGIGVLLLNQNKYLKLDSVFAIQILILLTGLAIDYLFGLIKEIIAPHVKFNSQNK